MTARPAPGTAHRRRYGRVRESHEARTLWLTRSLGRPHATRGSRVSSSVANDPAQSSEEGSSEGPGWQPTRRSSAPFAVRSLRPHPQDGHEPRGRSSVPRLAPPPTWPFAARADFGMSGSHRSRPGVPSGYEARLLLRNGLGQLPAPLHGHQHPARSDPSSAGGHVGWPRDAPGWEGGADGSGVEVERSKTKLCRSS
jgi:hypothetical protein